jgi:hypothetical protein
VVLGFELGAYTLSHSTNPLLWRVFFWGRGSWTIFLGWLWTVILLISASWVAGITGLSHLLPALNSLKCAGDYILTKENFYFKLCPSGLFMYLLFWRVSSKFLSIF